jgi:hypothetical protein
MVRPMEFRIARSARDRYALEETLFSLHGDALVIDMDGAERLAERLVPEDPDAQIRVGAEVSALGLIHELGHRAVAVERRSDPGGGGPMARAMAVAQTRLGDAVVRDGLSAFETAFPAGGVYRGEATAGAWLDQERDGVTGPETTLEEVALAWLATRNPAAAQYRALLDDPALSSPTMGRLVASVSGTDASGDDSELDRAAPARGLIQRLREPIDAAPQSLAAQLRWIRVNWAGWLDDADLLQIDRQLRSLAHIEHAEWLRHRRDPESGDQAHPSALAGFGGLDEEPEAFSQDRRWMAELVLLAKSTYVWLSQLSRSYGRPIARLDQIPDEELDELRERGITGLWLIGLWERSTASRRIKQQRGNPDAMASAYSVADYRIADELGGDDAWRDLRDRAMARGIRLAADMVPNHMGIDSDWVVEHPERFISSPHAPFESYSFTGDDLSSDDRVVIQLEDHYQDSSDAAVVFKRIDRVSGEERYIYHGNDGTSLPWNDTAQLDYLRADVREAVIGQILEVARRFHVIRFDAAMVLARRHIQRLWYPLPGHQGGIPSRSAAALPADELRRLMPAEFWREVVDRMAAEVPGTLLLAEAFWLMEGFFVRTVGMHRVYNSAFMHMLRAEKNAEYQQVIRETVAYDSRILGRYVNFMNNPDERSAIDQFGSDDKYFGVATLLATLPGLPMVGHGQIEGYSEKYGMEFRHPHLDETPNDDLVERHRREIFPLFRQRWRFSSSREFRQLLAVDGSGEVADVFAYTNRADHGPADHGPADTEERRSLVVYLNRYPRADVRVTGVSEALGVGTDTNDWLILRDQRSGNDFLRSSEDTAAHGLELALDGYGCYVFLGFEEVSDRGGAGWAELAGRIGLGGVPDAHAALRRMREEPIRAAVASVFATRAAEEAFLSGTAAETLGGAAALAAALERVREATGGTHVPPAETDETVRFLARTRDVRPRRLGQAVAAWALFRAIADVAADVQAHDASEAFDAWDTSNTVEDVARRCGSGDADAWRTVELVRALLVLVPGALTKAAEAEGLPVRWFEDASVCQASAWNRWQEQAFVSQEAWDELVDALAERDALLARSGVAAAASELKRRAATAGYRIASSGSALQVDGTSPSGLAPPR